MSKFYKQNVFLAPLLQLLPDNKNVKIKKKFAPLSNFLTLCRFTLCRFILCCAFDSLSFDPVSFDPMSVNQEKYVRMEIFKRDEIILMCSLTKAAGQS